MSLRPVLRPNTENGCAGGGNASHSPEGATRDKGLQMRDLSRPISARRVQTCCLAEQQG